MNDIELEHTDIFEGILLALTLTGSDKILENLRKVLSTSKYAYNILVSCTERKNASQIAEEINIHIGNLNKFTKPLLQSRWLNMQAKGNERLYKTNPIFSIIENFISEDSKNDK